MEFPNIGKQCSEPSCNRLDFLPVKCDACDKVFCSSHFHYDRHGCLSGHRKNIQVPVCPLCGEPVPTPPGTQPDITVGQHIDQQCKSETKKIFTNRCSYKGCKRKELVPVTCSLCKQNFCLRHRHSADHNCTQQQQTTLMNDNQRILVANAAEYRKSHKPTTLNFNVNTRSTVPSKSRQQVATNATTSATNSTQMQNIQGNMSEDEALARALALSIMELDETADRNRRNDATSDATTVSTVTVGGRDGQANGKDRCSMS